jgi:hypothetical protein
MCETVAPVVTVGGSTAELSKMPVTLELSHRIGAFFRSSSRSTASVLQHNHVLLSVTFGCWTEPKRPSSACSELIRQRLRYGVIGFAWRQV